MIITIDGPAGSGKSTVARKLAARLEVAYLDTGAMYRAVAYAGLLRQTDLSSEAACGALVRALRIELDFGPTYARIRVDGHDVSEAIRTIRVSAATSEVARHPAVRTFLVKMQRSEGDRLKSFVTEGRDQGSVVFPDADVKFVLNASAEKRAERRLQQLLVDGEDVTLEQVRENITQRDAIDAIRWQSLLEPGAAHIIDTTTMSISDVLDRLMEHV